VTALGNTTVSGGTGAGNAIDIITNGGVISQGILIDATTVECLYGPPPSPPQPVDCKSLLENIYVHIGEGRHLPVPEQELSLWERELLACYSAGKISEYEVAAGAVPKSRGCAWMGNESYHIESLRKNLPFPIE